MFLKQRIEAIRIRAEGSYQRQNPVDDNPSTIASGPCRCNATFCYFFIRRRDIGRVEYLYMHA